MEVLIYICLVGFGIFASAALVVWGIWIQRYVQLHGERPAFVLFNWASLIDYRKAHGIARRGGRKPWFLVWYERFQVAALIFFILGAVLLVIWNMRES